MPFSSSEQLVRGFTDLTLNERERSGSAALNTGQSRCSFLQRANRRATVLDSSANFGCRANALRNLTFADGFGAGSNAAYSTRAHFTLKINRFLITQEIEHVGIVICVIMA